MDLSNLSWILCCKCGVSMQPNAANTCLTCLSAEVDITQHIQRQNTITFCPKCERYLNPPSQWVAAAPESPELLSMCVKRVRGLHKGLTVRGAKFIWTEPHSRRLQIEVTVNGELQTGDLVEQVLPLEFVVHAQQCHDCTRSAAKDYWNACVQLRQRTDHKKTLLRLEQVILHCRAHKECTNIKQLSEGIDFFFGTRSQAVSFVNFVCKHAPCRYQTSQHLKSHDIHNNTYNYKFTFSIEMAPICKNDIVCLSKLQSQKMGGIGPICVVTKVAEAIHLIDPITCRIYRVDSASYFASPFTAIANQRQLTLFTVLEIEDAMVGPVIGASHKQKLPAGPPVANGRLSKRHCPVSVWLMRLNQPHGSGSSGLSDEMNPDDGTVHTRSHLGRIINVGDTVYGLDLRNCNINHTEFEKLPQEQLPDIILVWKPAQSDDLLDMTDTRSVSTISVRRAKRRRKNRSVAPCYQDDSSSVVEAATIQSSNSDQEFDNCLEDCYEDEGFINLDEEQWFDALPSSS